jgi:hypothetical protein
MGSRRALLDRRVRLGPAPADRECAIPVAEQVLAAELWTRPDCRPHR